MNTFLIVLLVYLLGCIISYISLKIFHTKICKEEWTYGDRAICLYFSFLSYMAILFILVGLVYSFFEIIERKYSIGELFDINNKKKAKW